MAAQTRKGRCSSRLTRGRCQRMRLGSHWSTGGCNGGTLMRHFPTPGPVATLALGMGQATRAAPVSTALTLVDQDVPLVTPRPRTRLPLPPFAPLCATSEPPTGDRSSPSSLALVRAIRQLSAGFRSRRHWSIAPVAHAPTRVARRSPKPALITAAPSRSAKSANVFKRRPARQSRLCDV
jgi:hypothetical protein